MAIPVISAVPRAGLDMARVLLLGMAAMAGVLLAWTTVDQSTWGATLLVGRGRGRGLLDADLGCFLLGSGDLPGILLVGLLGSIVVLGEDWPLSLSHGSLESIALGLVLGAWPGL